MGLLPVRPAEVLLSYTGPDTTGCGLLKQPDKRELTSGRHVKHFLLIFFDSLYTLFFSNCFRQNLNVKLSQLERARSENYKGFRTARFGRRGVKPECMIKR
jgi:hypothetical protein